MSLVNKLASCGSRPPAAEPAFTKLVSNASADGVYGVAISPSRALWGRNSNTPRVLNLDTMVQHSAVSASFQQRTYDLAIDDNGYFHVFSDNSIRYFTSTTDGNSWVEKARPAGSAQYNNRLVYAQNKVWTKVDVTNDLMSTSSSSPANMPDAWDLENTNFGSTATVWDMDANSSTALVDDFHNIRIGPAASPVFIKQDNQGIALSVAKYGSFAMITYQSGFAQWTNDNGTTWTTHNFGSGHRVAVDRSSGQVLVAGGLGSTNVYTSTDFMGTFPNRGVISGFEIHNNQGFQPIAISAGRAILAGRENAENNTLYLAENL